MNQFICTRLPCAFIYMYVMFISSTKRLGGMGWQRPRPRVRNYKTKTVLSFCRFIIEFRLNFTRYIIHPKWTQKKKGFEEHGEHRNIGFFYVHIRKIRFQINRLFSNFVPSEYRLCENYFFVFFF